MKNKIGIIIGREFSERVHKKSFIITTLLTPILMIVLIFAPMLISGYSDDSAKMIAVVDDSGIIASQLANTGEVVFEQTPLPLEIARSEYSGYYAVLHIGNDIVTNPGAATLYTNGTAAMGTEHNIASQLTMAVQKEKMKMYNVEQHVMQELNTPVMPQSLKNSADEEDAESSSAVVASVLAYVLSFILYMFLILYGVMVMQSVIEEKNNRVLEVMVSSVKPFDLMMGKILGVGSVAVLQVVIWGVLILGMGTLVVPHLMPDEVMASATAIEQGAALQNADLDPEMMQAIAAVTDVSYLMKIFVSMILFVFGGFLLYAAMFAAVGSAVDNVQDASQLQTPITVPIILGLLMMMAVINDPTSKLAFWFSVIPLTSPIVMMARIPYDIPTWEIVLSLVVLYASFVALVWFAAKIYRVGIFMYGKKPTLKELWKWMRYN